MRINLRLCVSLAIFSAAFSQFAKSDSFNNVIDDFDIYLQLEQEGQVPQKPLNTQGQGYDSFLSLPLAPEPKEKSKSAVSKKNTGQAKGSVRTPSNTQRVVNKQVQPKVTTPNPTTPKEVAMVSLSECPMPENTVAQQTGSARQSLLLSSYPYLFDSKQWHPQYLSRDFAKYQIVLDPLGLYSSRFSASSLADNDAYLQQLADLLAQQQATHLFKFGAAQGAGQLIAYHQLLTDRQLVEKLIAHNKTVAELSHAIAEKQFEIERINSELTENKNQIALLQEQLKATDDKETIVLLTDELSLAKNTITEKQNNLDLLTLQNEQAQQVIKQLELKLGESVKAQAVAESQLAEKDKQLEQAKLEFENTQKQVEQLTAQITQLEADAKEQAERLNKNSDEQVKLVTASLNKQQELLKQKEEALQLAEKQKNDLQAELIKQQDASKTFENDLKTAQQQLQTQKIDQEALVKQYEGSQRAQQQLQEKLTQSELNYTEAQAQLKQATADVAQLQNEIEKQKQLMTQASDEQVKSLTAELNQQVALLKQQQDVAQKMAAESQSARDELIKQQEAAKQLEDKLKIAQQQLQTQKAEQETLTKQYGDSQQAQQQLQAKLAENENAFSAAQAQLKQANSDVALLQKEIEKQKQLMTQATDQQIKALSADLDQQVAQLKQKEAAL
ncbi:hypothetical protein AB7W11_02800, partial [Providencia manganoxydans]